MDEWDRARFYILQILDECEVQRHSAEKQKWLTSKSDESYWEGHLSAYSAIIRLLRDILKDIPRPDKEQS